MSDNASPASSLSNTIVEVCLLERLASLNAACRLDSFHHSYDCLPLLIRSLKLYQETGLIGYDKPHHTIPQDFFLLRNLFQGL